MWSKGVEQCFKVNKKIFECRGENKTLVLSAENQTRQQSIQEKEKEKKT